MCHDFHICLNQKGWGKAQAGLQVWWVRQAYPGSVLTNEGSSIYSWFLTQLVKQVGLIPPAWWANDLLWLGGAQMQLAFAGFQKLLGICEQTIPLF